MVDQRERLREERMHEITVAAAAATELDLAYRDGGEEEGEDIDESEEAGVTMFSSPTTAADGSRSAEMRVRQTVAATPQMSAVDPVRTMHD